MKKYTHKTHCMYLIPFLNFLSFLTYYRYFTESLIPNKYQIPNLLSIKTKDLTWTTHVLKVF